MLSLQQKWLAAQTTKRQIDEQIWNTPDLVVMRPLGQSSVAFFIAKKRAVAPQRMSDFILSDSRN